MFNCGLSVMSVFLPIKIASTVDLSKCVKLSDSEFVIYLDESE